WRLHRPPAGKDDEGHCDDNGDACRDRGGAHDGAYWLAHTIRATHSTSAMGSSRTGWAGLSDRSVMVFAVWRSSTLAITSPLAVLTTTRSPLRTVAPGSTISTSPSR